jgi:hypothetical protein
MYEGKIPFDQHGNPVPYYNGVTRGPHASFDSDYIWEDNAPFRAVLDFKRFARGRSAAHAIYAKADDPTWECVMFLTDFTDVVERGLAPLRLSGRFEHVKRGSNYGVKLLLIGG